MKSNSDMKYFHYIHEKENFEFSVDLLRTQYIAEDKVLVFAIRVYDTKNHTHQFHYIEIKLGQDELEFKFIILDQAVQVPDADTLNKAFNRFIKKYVLLIEDLRDGYKNHKNTFTYSYSLGVLFETELLSW